MCERSKRATTLNTRECMCDLYINSLDLKVREMSSF